MSKQATIYIVDDDELILETLSEGLEMAGYAVQSFSKAQDFLDCAPKISNACLILDLKMPEHSGLDIQRALKAQHNDIPIIIYSGEADVDTAVSAMKEGALTVLQKPVSISKLMHAVEAALHAHAQQQAQRNSFEQAKNQLALLSKREYTIAGLVAQGLSANDIAEKLFISNRTVEAHKSSIFQKLDIHSVANLTQLVMLEKMANNQDLPD